MSYAYYISGPMRGLPHFNFPAFFECEEYMREYVDIGATYHNPARKDGEEGWNPESRNQPTEAEMQAWMRRDLTDVAASDELILLPGWEGSQEARREMAVAQWCGLMVALYDPEGRHLARLMPADWDDLADIARKYDAKKKQAEEEGELLESIDEAFKRAWQSEVRTTSSSGGQKGVKPERHDLVPTDAMAVVAAVYGYGAQKYDDHNWRKGYEWSKSYAAMQRHAQAFWGGEDIDPESGLPHMGHAAFHALSLLEFAMKNPEFDDRYATVSKERA